MQVSTLYFLSQWHALVAVANPSYLNPVPPLTFTLSLDLLPECADNKNLSWKPAFLSNEELGQLMLEVRSIDEEL